VTNCKSCSAEGSCAECRSGFWLQSDDCCVECGTGNRQYLDGIKKCASCSVSNCLYCQTTEATCSYCNNDYFLKSNNCDNCIDTGEIQLTTSNSGDTCQVCVTDCIECTTAGVSGICRKCTTNQYVRFSTKSSCVLCDATDDVKFNNYCLVGTDCDANCKRCLDFEQCSTCNDGYYLSGDQKKCVPCPCSCQLCTSFDVCTKCDAGYFLLDSSSPKICTPCGVAGGSEEEGQTRAGKIFIDR
jgi:proprotein convertase subtilisin/kexin type 5